MAEQRLIDANAFKDCWKPGVIGDTLQRVIDEQPTIDPETLPIVKELCEQVKSLQTELSNWDFWYGPIRKREAEVMRENQAAVKVMRKRCEKTIAELRAELKQVKAERDAALADLEYTACCETCAHGCNKPGKICCFCDNRECTCKTCAGGESWKWRGIVSENEEEKNDQS